jgi:hypothetical protein
LFAKKRVDVLRCWGYASLMAEASVNITADALEYVQQKFLRLFGKDSESTELANWFRAYSKQL